MTRFARVQRVFFVEEPIFDAQPGEGHMEMRICPQTGVRVVVPHLAEGGEATNRQLSNLIEELAIAEKIDKPMAWFYTPMALEFFPASLQPSLIVYDCMDELSQFRGAPPRMLQMEEQLLQQADVVFTGGVSLYEAKQHKHDNVHAMPSGVDIHHFTAARSTLDEHGEHRDIPAPRIGYAGVIDERIDLDVVEALAAENPEWQIVMIGPVAKIPADQLPQRPNLHWLGMKAYGDLPKYFAGWDVAIMPFALNEATQFISPTKTPEYLAAGLPVVSTAVRDVVRPYGDADMVRIGHSVPEFVEQVAAALEQPVPEQTRVRIDAHLQRQSWDSVWDRMSGLISKCLAAQQKKEVVNV